MSTFLILYISSPYPSLLTKGSEGKNYGSTHVNKYLSYYELYYVYDNLATYLIFSASLIVVIALTSFIGRHNIYLLSLKFSINMLGSLHSYTQYLITLVLSLLPTE